MWNRCSNLEKACSPNTYGKNGVCVKLGNGLYRGIRTVPAPLAVQRKHRRLWRSLLGGGGRFAEAPHMHKEAPARELGCAGGRGRCALGLE